MNKEPVGNVGSHMILLTFVGNHQNRTPTQGVRAGVVSAIFLFCSIAAAQSFQYSVRPAAHFPDPIGPYLARQVPEPSFGNTPRLEPLLKDGKLMLSLSDAVTLALENNLDLAIA